MNDKSKAFYKKIYFIYGIEFDLLEIDIKLFNELASTYDIDLPSDIPNSLLFQKKQTPTSLNLQKKD